MGLGILILLQKQLRESGSILYSTLVITVMLTPPLSSVGPIPFIVLTKKSYLCYQIIINNLTLVTMVTAITWKKVVWKAQVIILSGYQKILTQKNRYSLLYQASIFILCTFYCFPDTDFCRRQL